MTRLAVGPADDPQLPPLFVTAGRAAFAGLLSRRLPAASPARRGRAPTQLPALAVCARSARWSASRCSSASRCATSTRCTPPWSPACCRWPPRWRRRCCSASGRRSASGPARRRLRAGARFRGDRRAAAASTPPTGCCCCAVASTSIGYVAGARCRDADAAEQVICWVLVLSLPLTLPVMLAQLAGAAGARRRPGAASPTSRCSRCGSASSPGTAAWRSAARCG